MSAPIYDANGKPFRKPYRLGLLEWAGIVLVAQMWLMGSCRAQASEVTRQISAGQSWSEIYLPSKPTISPDSRFAVYVQDAQVNGANELWSVPLAGGEPVRLSDALVAGQSVKFQITPNSQRVVYLTDQDAIGVPDLYSVPISGGAIVKLSMPLAVLSGQVRDFVISPTSARVYFAADGAVNNVMELWRVNIDGGPSTRLNASIASNYDVFDYAASQQDRVVYRIGRSDVGGYSLWSVPGDGRGAQARRISTWPMVTGGAVASDFKISGERVVYRADAEDNGRFDLYSVAITGGASTLLDAGTGSVVEFERGHPDGSVVVYAQRIGSVTSWWAVSALGGTPTPATAPAPQPLRSPDGTWTLYGIGTDLWSDSSKGLQRVNCRGEIVTLTFLTQPVYSISLDSKTALYVANGELHAGPIAGAVCRIFSDGFEGGNVGAWR